MSIPSRGAPTRINGKGELFDTSIKSHMPRVYVPYPLYYELVTLHLLFILTISRIALCILYHVTYRAKFCAVDIAIRRKLSVHS